MLAREYDVMRSVEDDYWWYRVLRGITVREIMDCLKMARNPCILDAGCGTGGTMQAVKERLPNAHLTGVDVSALALEHTRARGFRKVLEADVSHINVEDSTQDIVISLDVLYHEGVDQEAAMQEFRRVLRPDGRLIMNLPAFECLRGQHDVAVKNVRRYTLRDVLELHERHGFAIEKNYCWNAWLFLPILVFRKLSRIRASSSAEEAKSDLIPPPKFVNKILTVFGKLEAAMCRAISSPVGTSVFSVGRRRN